MRVKENLVGAMSAVIILGLVGAANAQTGETRGAQGLESVQKNIAKDTDTDKDNHGLTNAQRHIEDNMARKAAAKDKDKARHDKAMRAEKAERPDKADRPERPDRPERAGRS
jgi:hypothetical protein